GVAGGHVDGQLDAEVECSGQDLRYDAESFVALTGNDLEDDLVVDLEDQPPPAQDLPASSEDLSTRPINAQHAWLSSINPILCAMAPEYQRRVKGTSEEQDLQSFWQAAQQVARRLRLPQPLGADYLPATDQQRLVIQQQHNDLQMRQTPTHLPLWQADGPWLDCSGNATILDAGDLLTGSARQLQVAGQQLHLQQLTRPPWAERLWRNQDGLFAAHGDGAVLQLVEAGPEQPKAVWQMVYNPWPWAREIGVDDEGLWAEFAINGVGQVMRWIVPGEFVMGSPQEEAERDDDERQHQVTLSQGFWLAETACTQELWQVVMGNNPSRFTDNLQNPVEQICWDDCQQFCQRANALLEGLQLRLPTEAQWEYACRAGTSTPFSFGEQITTGQANYDGNFPYTDGPKGEYRRQTVPVSEFEPNHWGLLQMHGNVWEWC
ncbi:MAG: formylglycine-generating enzyme family protein, partial [Gammaproteobacteria bacterium]|nr:formylglycine-generating enzyme family protein [Gammaproteobacteria bacterium]